MLLVVSITLLSPWNFGIKTTNRKLLGTNTINHKLHNNSLLSWTVFENDGANLTSCRTALFKFSRHCRQELTSSIIVIVVTSKYTLPSRYICGFLPFVIWGSTSSKAYPGGVASLIMLRANCIYAWVTWSVHSRRFIPIP